MLAGYQSNLKQRDLPSPIASDNVQVLLSREERAGEVVDVAVDQSKEQQEIAASFGALGAAGGPDKQTSQARQEIEAIASEAQETLESGVESPMPRRASVLGNGYTTYITPTINASTTPEKGKHKSIQFLKATSPRLKHTLEGFERENRKMKESIDNFHNGDANVRSKLALLNTKNPLYQSTAVPFVSAFVDSGSNDKDAGINRIDPNSISIQSLEPANLRHIGEMYKMDKTLTTEQFHSRKDSTFIISNLNKFMPNQTSQTINMQSMSDFNAVSNCLKTAGRHKPLKKKDELKTIIEDKRRRLKY